PVSDPKLVRATCLVVPSSQETNQGPPLSPAPAPDRPPRDWTHRIDGWVSIDWSAAGLHPGNGSPTGYRTPGGVASSGCETATGPPGSVSPHPNAVSGVSEVMAPVSPSSSACPTPAAGPARCSTATSCAAYCSTAWASHEAVQS